jgi:hypothetical protein
VSVPCKLCEKRRARRHCPGIGAEICAQCCGSERENTINCPASCEYLREARFREQPPPVQEEQIPNKDIRLSEDFIRQHEPLVFSLALALKRAMETGNAVDFDAREALAAAIQQSLREAVEELRKGLAEQYGMHTLRDADVLGVLVFLQRLEIQHNNGRRRGRAFRDFLTAYIPESPPESPATMVTA